MDVKVMPAPVEEYQRLIEQDFPDFGVKSIKYLGSGWDSAAMLVNEQYVFRFPRGLFEKSEPIKSDEIQKEVNILNFLSGKTSFDVPKPSFVEQDYKYFGYKLVTGTLWDQAPDQLSDDYLQSWVRTRSEISKTISLAEAPGLKIPSYRTDKSEKLVNEFLADKSANSRVKQIAQEAMEYVLAGCKSKDSWVFIHEDLQMSNCMVDPSDHKITGVIDWLEAEIGPVEAEFYFWSKCGQDVLGKVAKMQEEYDGTKIDPKLARSIHQFYIVADYQDFTVRGFTESGAHKWRQIERYLR